MLIQIVHKLPFEGLEGTAILSLKIPITFFSPFGQWGFGHSQHAQLPYQGTKKSTLFQPVLSKPRA